MISTILALQDEASLWLNIGATALVILLVGAILGRIGRNLVSVALNKLQIDLLTKNYGFSIRDFTSMFVEFLFDAGAFIWATRLVGILSFLGYSLLIIAGIVICVSLLFWLRDGSMNLFYKNVLYKKNLENEKHVRIGTLAGTITKKGLFFIEAQTIHGRVEMPYSWLRRNIIK